MELRHIRYFLAIAETRNFTRAAARLGIGQPPLSLQIKDLEAEIGASLFHRVPHGAELTEAGSAFLEAVRSLPEQVQQAKHAAQRAARGETGQLSLGFIGTAAVNPVTPACIRAFRQHYPEVALKLEEANSVSLIKGLLDGRLDVAILRLSKSDPDSLKILKLVEEPLVVALPVAHPVAQGRGALALADLKDEPFILTPRSIGAGLHDAALSACRGAGFEAQPGQPATQIASILSLVSAGLGVSLVPASMRQLGVKGVAYRNLRGPAARVSLGVAYRSKLPSRLATNFATLARATARQLDEQG